MAQENWQKYKLLKLLELLRQETDEQHPLSTSQICSKLGEMGISCERRTLTKDIAVLNELGYEVMWNWVGKEKGYYIEDRSFSVPELKILIDAVQAASFVTEKKTAELIDKIAALGGSHKADILKSNMVCFNTRKHSNESIYYNVGFLEDAIQQQKKVIFYYYDLNENGEKVYRREHHHYVVEPIALVFNDDNYYLMNVIYARFCFYDFHFHLFAQLSQYFSYIFSQCFVDYLPSVLWCKDNVILAAITRVCCMLYFIFHYA